VSVFFAMFYVLVFVKDLLQDVFATHALLCLCCCSVIYQCYGFVAGDFSI
jgi:hypothetical protein